MVYSEGKDLMRFSGAYCLLRKLCLYTNCCIKPTEITIHYTWGILNGTNATFTRLSHSILNTMKLIQAIYLWSKAVDSGNVQRSRISADSKLTTKS